jgi:hypothetical protein
MFVGSGLTLGFVRTESALIVPERQEISREPYRSIRKAVDAQGHSVKQFCQTKRGSGKESKGHIGGWPMAGHRIPRTDLRSANPLAQTSAVPADGGIAQSLQQHFPRPAPRQSNRR